MRKTYVTAAFIAAMVIGWIGSGFLEEATVSVPKSIADKNERLRVTTEDRPASQVRVSTSFAQEQNRLITLRGRTENKRTVSVQAQVGGLVAERRVERGDRVESGDVLCEIAVEDRSANLKEALAGLAQAELDLNGMQQLAAKGLQSEAMIASSQSAMAAAQARVERRQLEQSQLKIRAPFAGIVEETFMEVGQLASPGSQCVSLVDLDPMLLIGEVSERDRAELRVGQGVRATLSDGREINGQVSFIGHVAQAGTRTYSVEALVENPDFAIASGLIASIDIVTGLIKVHNISPALLVLDDSGQTGIRAVSALRTVEFHPVEILAQAGQAVSVTGLPDVLDLIVVGQQSVIAGERVAVRQAGTGAMGRAAL
jgi:membrane fusion protein, multidrug efflux system